MSLQTNKSPLIARGWVRALLLFLIYSLFSVASGFFIASAELWFFASFIIAFALVYIFRVYVDRKSFNSLGLNLSNLFPDGLIGFLVGLFLISTGSLVIYLAGGMQWIDINLNGPDIFTSIGLLLMVALSEELVFRGYILRNLMKSFNKWIALVISAVLFTLIHTTNPGIPLLGILNIFLGGLLLGITYIHTRNIWVPVFFHFSWNFFQGPILGFPVSGLPFNSLLTADINDETLISGGPFGFEGSVVCTAILLLSVIVTSYLHNKYYKPVIAA